MDQDKQADFARWCTTVLQLGRTFLQELQDGDRIIHEGAGFGDLKNDTEIKADRELGLFLRDQLRRREPVSRISVEGLPDEMVDAFEGHPLWVTVDPLDGSLNHRTRRGTIGLPHTSCLTALKVTAEPFLFNQIVVGCVVDHRSGDWWRAFRLGDEPFVTWCNGELARTHPDTKLDLGKHIVIGEMYYSTNRDRLIRAFVGERGNLRNPGSAAYEMALVASGTAIAFICDRQKQHELGAGYALVKGAGGVALDWDGKDLATREYTLNTQTPVILAANLAIADQILERLHR